MLEFLVFFRHALFALGVLIVGVAAWWQLGEWVKWLWLELRPKPKPEEWADAVDVVNHDMMEHKLEGPILRRLVIYANVSGNPRIQRVQGPLYQMEMGTLVKYDAFTVVDDMLVEYAMSRQLGVNMRPDQARRAVRDYFQIELVRVRKNELP
jgi:hypothetical protein